MLKRNINCEASFKPPVKPNSRKIIVIITMAILTVEVVLAFVFWPLVLLSLIIISAAYWLYKKRLFQDNEAVKYSTENYVDMKLRELDYPFADEDGGLRILQKTTENIQFTLSYSLSLNKKRVTINLNLEGQWIPSEDIREALMINDYEEVKKIILISNQRKNLKNAQKAFAKEFNEIKSILGTKVKENHVGWNIEIPDDPKQLVVAKINEDYDVLVYFYTYFMVLNAIKYGSAGFKLSKGGEIIDISPDSPTELCFLIRQFENIEKRMLMVEEVMEAPVEALSIEAYQAFTTDMRRMPKSLELMYLILNAERTEKAENCDIKFFTIKRILSESYIPFITNIRNLFNVRVKTPVNNIKYELLKAILYNGEYRDLERISKIAKAILEERKHTKARFNPHRL